MLFLYLWSVSPLPTPFNTRVYASSKHLGISKVRLIPIYLRQGPCLPLPGFLYYYLVRRFSGRTIGFVVHFRTRTLFLEISNTPNCTTDIILQTGECGGIVLMHVSRRKVSHFPNLGSVFESECFPLAISLPSHTCPTRRKSSLGVS